MRNWLVSLLLLLIGRRRPKPLLDPERVVPPGPEEPRAELAAIVLLACGTLCAIAFVAVYALDRLPNQTQLLGAALGLSLLFIAAALIVTSKKLIVDEEIEDDYPVPEHVEEQETIVRIVEESGSRLTRRRLFKLSLGAAGGALGLAILTPAASLGPVLDMDPFYGTPWKKGRRLVDESGKPWRADDIEQNDFYTAFPEGADKEALGSPLVLVRLDERELKSHKRYAAKGIVAYSKICTHAGCAISLYRAPLFQPDEPRPALVCPCHYSTFDPADGGTVTFGPAGRKLPMLPLEIDAHGNLRAAGNFDGPVGPSWWGVRRRRPSPR
jgi:ubiquinol-cytochrome c reductase iron-sulfur subunit